MKHKLPYCIVIFLMMIPLWGYSQITITSGDFLGFIGSRQTVVEDERFSIPVNVGLAGANQIWDLTTNGIVDSVFVVFEYFEPTGTPFDTAFPQSNLVQKT